MDIQEAITELKYQNKMWSKGIDYQVNNLVIAEAIDALERKEDYLKNIDYLSQINLWLILRYREDLFKEFCIDSSDILSVSEMFDAIYEEQRNEPPLTWNQYLFWKKD